ncbi:MAG: hypothetical protein C0490_11265, partial [Marivirga sp.]|nr:hypothetical protein [Marivirga sp.]
MNTWYKGVIKEDPQSSMPIGSKLNFQPVDVTHNMEAGFFTLKDTDLDGMLLSFCFGNSDVFSLDGCGILIGPGVALCVKHVIEPHVEDIMGGKKSSIAIGYKKDAIQIWRLRKISLIPNCDLAIIGLSFHSDIPSDLVFKLPCITTRLPQVGENLIVYAFKATAVDFKTTTTENESPILEPEVTFLTSNGKVTQSFFNGRDTSMLPGPCIEVECQTFPGMSGGPVFDSYGKLIGLLSTSLDVGPPSFVSLLWPALGHQNFEGGWPPGPLTKSRSLISCPGCYVDKRTAIRVEEGQVKYFGW